MLFMSLSLAQDVSFVVVGDTQAETGDSVNWDVFPQMIEDMNALSPDFAFFVGDLVNGSYNLERQVEVWNDWIVASEALTMDRYAVAGNHDMFARGSKAAWGETFSFLPRANSPEGDEGLTYWFDVGNCRFVSVLTDVDGGATAELSHPEWLEALLADADTQAKDHVFVFTHHPVSWSTYDLLGGTFGGLWQALVQNDVDALFAGHWHLYQPGQLGNGGNTWEVIDGTGGGWQGYDPIRLSNLGHGFIKVDIWGGQVEVSFYRDDDGDGHYDDVADQFVLKYAEGAPTGLVWYYPFDDDLTDIAPEPAGHGLTGQLHGDAAFGAGVVGQAVTLDGNDDYVEVAAINAYRHSVKGDTTLALWARFDADGAEWGNTLVSYATNDYYSEDEETNYAYWLNIQPSRTLRFFAEYGDGTNITLDSTVPAAVAPGEWHHYAVVRDATAMAVTFYVDGAPLGEPVAFSQLPTGASRGYLTFGADTTGSGAYELAGAIDEACLFNEARSAVDIAAIYTTKSCFLEETPPDTGGETGTEPTDDSGTTDTVGDSRPPADTVAQDTAEGQAKDQRKEEGCGCGGGLGATPGIVALAGLGVCRG